MLCSILVFSVPSSLLPSPLSLFQSFATSVTGLKKNLLLYPPNSIQIQPKRCMVHQADWNVTERNWKKEINLLKKNPNMLITNDLYTYEWVL